MEASKTEQRSVIRFLVAEGNSSANICRRMKNVYGVHCLGRTALNNWCKKFRGGRTSIQDNPRPGQAHTVITDESVAAVNEIITKDRRVTTRAIVEATNLSKGSVQTIVHKHLNFRKVCAHWVPKHLSDDHKLSRMSLSMEHLFRYSRNPEFLMRIVAGDESWCHHYTPETKTMSKQWKHPSSPPPRKSMTMPSAGKVMLTFFFRSS
jgi:hypothetical protein